MKESDQPLCIRCDDPVIGDTRFEDDSDWTILIWGHEEEVYPIHKSCYKEVRGRDQWD